MNYVSSQSFHTLNHWQSGSGSADSGTELYDGYEKDGWSIWGVKDSSGEIALLPVRWYEDGYNKEPIYTLGNSDELKFYSPVPEISEDKLIKGYKQSSGQQYGLYGPYGTKTIATAPSKSIYGDVTNTINYIEASYDKTAKRFVAEVENASSGSTSDSDYKETISFGKEYVGNVIELEIDKYIVVSSPSGSLTGDFEDTSAIIPPLYNLFTTLNNLICPMPDNAKDYTLIYPSADWGTSGHIGLMDVDTRYSYTNIRDTTGGYFDETKTLNNNPYPGLYIGESGSEQYAGVVPKFWFYNPSSGEYDSPRVDLDQQSIALYGASTYGSFYSYDSSDNRFVVLRRIKKINVIKDFAFFS